MVQELDAPPPDSGVRILDAIDECAEGGVGNSDSAQFGRGYATDQRSHCFEALATAGEPLHKLPLTHGPTLGGVVHGRGRISARSRVTAPTDAASLRVRQDPKAGPPTRCGSVSRTGGKAPDRLTNGGPSRPLSRSLFVTSAALSSFRPPPPRDDGGGCSLRPPGCRTGESTVASRCRAAGTPAGGGSEHRSRCIERAARRLPSAGSRQPGHDRRRAFTPACRHETRQSSPPTRTARRGRWSRPAVAPARWNAASWSTPPIRRSGACHAQRSVCGLGTLPELACAVLYAPRRLRGTAIKHAFGAAMLFADQP